MRAYQIGKMLSAAVLGLSLSSVAHAQTGAVTTITTGPGGFALARSILAPRLNAGTGLSIGRPTGAFVTTAAPLVPAFNPSEVVPTDPLVRQTQTGITPVGILGDVDPARGIGVAGVPGAGGRIVRTVGPVIQTAAGPAVRAVDASTGVTFMALVPQLEPVIATNPGELVPAKVVRLTGASVILEREANGKTLTEILPSEQVYTPVRGGFVPAASLRLLRAGAEVFIPLKSDSRGTITVTRPAGFGTRASSASTSRKGR